MSKEFPLTPHRIRILEILRDHGEIRDDPGGQAVRELMKHTGHQTTNALSGVLQAMEQAGLIRRETAGRRTYSITLTKAGERVVKNLATEPHVTYDDELVDTAPRVSIERVVPPVPVEAAAFERIDLLAARVLELAVAAGQGGGGERVAELETRIAELETRNIELEAANAALRQQLTQVSRGNGELSPTSLRDLERVARHLANEG